MRIARHVSEGLRPVVDLVYPPRCPLCGNAIADQGGLCAECWSELEVPGEPSCETCNLPTASGKTRCFACEVEPPQHAGVHAATLYNDASRKLILTFKHGGKIALGGLLARLIATRLPAEAEGALLVPVPLHRWRLWRRGFNQSALLARELARMGKGEIAVDALERTRRTPSLGGMGKSQRERALSGAIEVRRSRRGIIAGREVILVDDVLTSGATSDVCVAALLDAGAKSVRVACFARVADGSGFSGTNPKNTTPEAMKTPGAT